MISFRVLGRTLKNRGALGRKIGQLGLMFLCIAAQRRLKLEWDGNVFSWCSRRGDTVHGNAESVSQGRRGTAGEKETGPTCAAPRAPRQVPARCRTWLTALSRNRRLFNVFIVSTAFRQAMQQNTGLQNVPCGVLHQLFYRACRCQLAIDGARSKEMYRRSYVYRPLRAGC